jgi:hypothetical protein
VKTVSTKDQAQLSKVLARAFEHDPILRWIIPEDRDYVKFSQRLFGLQIRNAASRYTNEAKSGVALWIGPNNKQNPFSQIISSLKTIWLLKDNLTRAYRLQKS